LEAEDGQGEVSHDEVVGLGELARRHSFILTKLGVVSGVDDDAVDPFHITELGGLRRSGLGLG